MQKRWRILPHDSGRIERLVQSAGVPPVVAQLLVSRGVYDGAEAKRFLDVRLTDLRDPLELPGVEAAADLLFEAVAAKQRITVYGDYDCDGMTGAAILTSGLRLIGGDVGYYVPNRLEDGYGLSDEAIRRLASHGTQMIVSVDCGITSVRQAELCRELGLRLIVTDHHELAAALPAADVLVHPRLPGTNYPFGELCGAGVAFKLAWAICQRASGAKKVSERLRNYLMRALSLAAIGTVADMVPLVDENRVLVRHGLRSLQSNPPPGLAELMRLTGLHQKPALSSEDIAFSIGPRLNAAGRLGQAQLGVELLTVSEGERAAALAEYLHQLNSSRESLERSVFLAAQKQAKAEFDPEGDPALVLAGSGWHAGVIGVVAGRLAERYGKPVIVVSIDPVSGKPAVGSGRAGGAIDLHAALGESCDRLLTFGGHRAAAGLKIEEAQLDAFRGDFCEAVARQNAGGVAEPEVVIDAETALAHLTLETLQQMESLAPFGQGNPRPVLLASGVSLCEPSRRMGGGDRHLSARIEHRGTRMRSVAFGQGEWCDDLNQTEGTIDIAFRPVVNEFRGRRTVEAQLVDWRPSQVRSPEVKVPGNTVGR
ncbi:single-stranded-DNA-specific exonuclease RecJ [Candidatus Laterigemmans baculatus]|uniref:single-stranded-DNA-specific exonuclease RecJ n=1 Tax=Candidatus Laterigemmans baculatus TaxID=2770505 RepID=UPI0013DB2504|nr:single-stranded-DNA-specific exonuclease RecJ [Candidatus Laterigemmans baculatus]